MTSNVPNRRIAIATTMLVLAGAEAVAQQANPAAAYAESAAPSAPVSREFASSAWGSAASGSSLSGNIAWQVLKNAPTTSQRALVTLTDTRSLSLSLWSGASWGAPSTLTSEAGTYASRVFAAEYEKSTGNLMVVYRRGSSSSVYYRSYTTATPTESTIGLSLSAAPTWVCLACKPGSNELVVVVAAGSTLSAAVWNGTSWGNSVTLESSLPTSGRPFAAAYSTASGQAVVAWTATTGAPKYRVWTGSAWNSAGTMPAIAGGVAAGWLTLAANPAAASNELLFACIGTNNQINANNWTGSAWGTNLVVETSAASNTTQRCDVCYESGGTNALLAWHSSGQAALRYRLWTGGAWSAQQVGPDMGSESKTIQLAPGSGTNEIVMLARRAGAASYADYTVYSQSGTVTVGTTTITGQVGQQVTGVALPSPPSASAGSTPVTVANTQTQTLAPGSYAALTLGDSGTLNLSSGTYIFSSVTMHDKNKLNFNTSGGPIDFIVTSGGANIHDSNVFNNTGNSPVVLHLLGGDLTAHDKTVLTNVDIFAYNGAVGFNNTTSGTANIYASGAQTFGSGTLAANPYTFGAPTRCTGVLWTGGVAGSCADLSTSVVRAGTWEPASLAGSGGSRLRITRWREVGVGD